jgi:hypothetical protein
MATGEAGEAEGATIAKPLMSEIAVNIAKEAYSGITVRPRLRALREAAASLGPEPRGCRGSSLGTGGATFPAFAAGQVVKNVVNIESEDSEEEIALIEAKNPPTNSLFDRKKKILRCPRTEPACKGAGRNPSKLPRSMYVGPPAPLAARAVTMHSSPGGWTQVGYIDLDLADPRIVHWEQGF